MGKLVDAEITLKYSNGQLTIASTPNTIKGDGLLSYLDLAECAIIGANYKNLNEAMDIAAEHASAIIATVMHTAGNEKTSPKMGAIVHAAQVSPFYTWNRNQPYSNDVRPVQTIGRDGRTCKAGRL